MTDGRITALPCWQGAPRAEPLSGGLSNEIWKVTDDAGAHVLRFGKDYPFHHVSRAREAMTSRAAHAAGFAPAVEYAAPGVMVTAFVNARTWGAAEVCAAPARIAALLRRFHHEMPAQISGEAYLFWVFHVIRDYARTLDGAAHADDLPHFLRLCAALEAVQVPLPIIFGHNDLLPANILEDENRLWLIDYEYAGYSTALFDLAGAASNARMSPDQARVLLESYFDKPADAALLRAFEAMKCASLLRETMWAMVSDLHLSAPGADYAAYITENRAGLDAQIAVYEAIYGKLLP
ncbi:MAG: phosphotransferase [Pseudorhodobacter sp.]|nr:phosphotransferase [Pseudorhodobacter sp.]